MADLHLITGYAGEPHIGSSDAGSFNAAIFGSASVVLNRGSKFAATVISATQIRIADGDLLIQGRHTRLDTYADLSIDNGSQGYNRNDLIVARYSKDTETGVESCSLTVLTGTPATGTASDPEYIVGDILDGTDAQADFPLYRIPLNGLTVGTPVQLFGVVAAFADHVASRSNPHGVTPSQIGASASSHNHDSRYYTEAEVDTKLAGKANASHTHDDRYYTESEVNSLISSHNHDGRYYTEAEIDSKLSGKANTSHTHSDYLPKSGGTMTGALTAKGIKLTSGTDYGTSLPSSGTTGQLFFLKV